MTYMTDLSGPDPVCWSDPPRPPLTARQRLWRRWVRWLSVVPGANLG